MSRMQHHKFNTRKRSSHQANCNDLSLKYTNLPTELKASHSKHKHIQWYHQDQLTFLPHPQLISSFYHCWYGYSCSPKLTSFNYSLSSSLILLQPICFSTAFPRLGPFLSNPPQTQFIPAFQWADQREHRLDKGNPGTKVQLSESFCFPTTQTLSSSFFSLCTRPVTTTTCTLNVFSTTVQLCRAINLSLLHVLYVLQSTQLPWLIR